MIDPRQADREMKQEPDEILGDGTRIYNSPGRDEDGRLCFKRTIYHPNGEIESFIIDTSIWKKQAEATAASSPSKFDPAKADKEMGKAPSSVKADGTRVYLEPMLDGRTRITIYRPDGTVESYKAINLNPSETSSAAEVFGSFSPTVDSLETTRTGSTIKSTKKGRHQKLELPGLADSALPVSERRVSAFWSWVLTCLTASVILIVSFWAWDAATRESTPLWGQLFLPGLALILIWRNAGSDRTRVFWGRVVSKRFLSPLLVGLVSLILLVIYEESDYYYRGNEGMKVLLLTILSVATSFILFLLARRSYQTPSR